jgi:chromosome segregation ATPase
MTAGAFFGSHIDTVRDCLRRREYCARTERALEECLRQLRSRRGELVERNRGPIQQQKTKIAETESSLKEAQSQLNGQLGKYHWLARINGSFWRKLGLAIGRLLFRKALTAREIKRRLRAMTAVLADAEDKVDYVGRIRSRQIRALRCLTSPIDQLDETIACLESQIDGMNREGADCDKAILDAVRDSVRAMPAASLATRLAGIGRAAGSNDLTGKV